MPTVLLLGPYRFFFYANERGEPAHILVQRDAALATFWLAPIALARSCGFGAPELTRLARIVDEHRDLSLEHWNERFGHRS